MGAACCSGFAKLFHGSGGNGARERPHENVPLAHHDVTSSSSPSTAVPSDACPKVSWEALVADASSERKAFCDRLASLGFAVIAAPRSTRRAASAVSQLAGKFFAKPAEEKQPLGNIRYSRGKLVGYLKRDDGAQFLEVHATPDCSAVPMPQGMSTFGPACGLLHTELLQMGRDVLCWLADHLGLPHEGLLACLDDPNLEGLGEDEMGACVLRLCNYALCDAEVVFGEHTDASFLTLAPVSTAPGLQMFHAPSGEWLDVERGLSLGDVVVFVGDFVEVLTKGAFPAALHRVVLREADAGSRISMPFLMRGQPSSRIHTAPLVDAAPGLPLMRIEDTSYEDLRLFLDLKGKKRMQHRALAAAKLSGRADAHAERAAKLDDARLAPSGGRGDVG